MRKIYGGNDYVIYESPPQYRTVIGYDVPARIPLPFVISVIQSYRGQCYKLYIFARNEPLVDGQSKLWHLPLPNVRIDNSVCMPKDAYHEHNPLDFTQIFWNSNFNTDIQPYGVPRALSKKAFDSSYFLCWAKHTTIDVLQWNWAKAISPRNDRQDKLRNFML